MRKKDIENKIANESKILELLNLYKEEFVNSFGLRGYLEVIDFHLDELNFWRSKLKKLNNEKDNNAGRNGGRH